MGFLDQYFDNFNLDDLDDTVVNRLDDFKLLLDKITSDETYPLGVVISNHSAEILDLIERFTKHFQSWDFSTDGIIGTFKFAWQIGVEIAQLVEDVASEAFSGGMTAKEVHDAKVSLVQDLVELLWKTFDPLSRAPWSWVSLIPFRSNIERLIVRWIAGMATDFVLDLLEANEVEAKASTLKALSVKEDFVFIKTVK